MSAAPPEDDLRSPGYEQPPTPSNTSQHRRPWWGGFQRSWPVWLLAFVSYIPLLLTAPGRVGADTKQYLYLDPDRMLGRAPYMWDPHVGAGTVTHQNIGYLLPMGPWYWAFQHLGVPDWVAQRLWTGSLLFLAGLGTLFLLQTFGWRPISSAVAAFAYALSPYVLEYEARISAILMPWAALPWLIALVVRGLRLAEEAGVKRRSRWRYPALLAITVALVGSVNATSLIYVLLGPILWFPFAVWVHHEVSLRKALAFTVRTAVLVILANLWWMSGLAAQSGYGLDVLAYSETVKTVASGSQASEVLRGLGNWYFYGADGIDAWVQPARTYTENLGQIAVSFALPLCAVAAAVVSRWRLRSYFVVLVAVGTTISVGVYPFANPSPLGGLFKDFAAGSTAGLALRSMPRAEPLVSLGLAVMLAAAVEALFERSRSRTAPSRSSRRFRLPAGRAVPVAAAGIVLVLIALDMSPLWQGQFVDRNLDRAEQLPSYMQQSADFMQSRGDATRVLELPGADFSHYRWGATLDPVPPGLMDRPYLSRELIPYGTPASADLLRALDRRLQEGVFEISALPDVARRLGVGDVELRSDLQYERFRTPRPIRTWGMFTAERPDGLGAPTTFGPTVSENPVVPLTDEVTLAEPPNAAKPPAVAVFPVQNPVPIVRAEADKSPLLVAGDGEGIVDAAATGLLNRPGVLLYSATSSNADVAQALDQGADLLLTDSNRRRAERWGTLRENYGFTERPGEQPLRTDVSDNRLPTFSGDTSDRIKGDPNTQTVAEQRGVASVEATDYGNPTSYAPADRPVNGVDGDLTTAWRVGAFSDVRKERWQLNLSSPTTTDRVNLVQPITGPRNRWMTKVRLSFDGGNPVTVNLNDASRTSAGQTITFPKRTFSRVDVTILDTNVGVQSQYNGASGVGIAELRVGGARVDEVLRLPTDLFTKTGNAEQNHRLVVQLTRDRADPAEPFKEDTEKTMARSFTLPTARSFSVVGTARVSAAASDTLVDRTTGRNTGPDVVTASSTVRLPGDVADRASSAFDGDPRTAWSGALGSPTGVSLQVRSPQPVSTNRLGLSIVADGQHSVPTALTLQVDGRTVGTVQVPPVKDGPAGTVRNVSVPIPQTTGRTFRLTVAQVREVDSRNYFSKGPIALPASLAEVDLAGLRVPPATSSIPSPCRSDLLKVDGKPVPVRVSGSASAAEQRQGLPLQLCGGSLRLSAGQHLLRTAPGVETGVDVDRLQLGSSVNGAALPATANAELALAPGGTGSAPQPAVTVKHSGETSFDLHVSGASSSFWLVLGQSLSPGWKATIGSASLGAPKLVDGYANGWKVDPKQPSFDVHLEWTPQHRVWWALGISAAALLLCLVLVALPGRRWRRPGTVPVELVNPIAPDERHRRVVRAVVAVLVTGLVVALVVKPLAAPFAMAALVLTVALPRGRLLLRIGAPLCLALTALYVGEVQFRFHLPNSGQWVPAFAKVATLSWFVVVLLVLDVVADWVRRSQADGDAYPPEDGSTADSTSAVDGAAAYATSRRVGADHERIRATEDRRTDRWWHRRTPGSARGARHQPGQ